jgi:GNAT superfamily N-acetyltransferase
MSQSIEYKQLHSSDFNALIRLAIQVHGEGYVNLKMLEQWHQQGIVGSVNAGFVAYHSNQLIGYRITFAAQQWDIDKWCTTEKWKTPTEQVCYFKCNTIDSQFRGLGVGSQLLKLSCAAAKAQGAAAGIAHLWMQSPADSAVQYFTHCGGQPIAIHKSRWNDDSKQGYICTLCDDNCHCDAKEMILYF